jgi:hypothetical protein
MSTIRANIITDAAGTGTPVFTNGFVTSTFTASGNVGIGTGSPLANLHVVNGTNPTLNFPTGDWAAKVFQQNDASTYNGLVVGNRWAADASTIFEAGSLYGGGGANWSTYFKITGLGAIGLNGSNYGTSGQILTSSGPSAVPSWTSSQSIGVGQTWQDFTGSRAVSTPYQNLTGRPISVQIRITASASPFQVSADNVTFVSIAAGTSTAGVGGWIGGIVPPNHYYRINGAATINGWSELR